MSEEYLKHQNHVSISLGLCAGFTRIRSKVGFWLSTNARSILQALQGSKATSTRSKVVAFQFQTTRKEHPPESCRFISSPACPTPQRPTISIWHHVCCPPKLPIPDHTSSRPAAGYTLVQESFVGYSIRTKKANFDLARQDSRSPPINERRTKHSVPNTQLRHPG